MPVQGPLKPEKLYPGLGAALRLTPVPGAKLAVQAPGQLIPEGVLVTVPLPAITTVTRTLAVVKVADTDWLFASTSWQEAPLHAPLKPAKLKPDPAAAVRTTEVPWAKLAAQVDGQLIPGGLLTIVPVPITLTLNWACCRGGGVAGLELAPQPEPATKEMSMTGKA